MKTETLSVDLLRTDAGTQCRISVSEDTVDDYAELIANSNGEWPLGNIVVFHDGIEYVVADGFHRTLAAHRAKRGSVPCSVHKGTATDARIFGMTANDRHGLRMTRADKRSCVEWLLDQPTKRSQTEVADLAGVSRRTVASIVADRKPRIVQTSQTFGGADQPKKKPPKSKPTPTEPPTPSVRATRVLEEAGIEPTPEQAAALAQYDAASQVELAKNVAIGAQDLDTAVATGEIVDFGECPVCNGAKWSDDGSGLACNKCHHPHGEPAGDPDERAKKEARTLAVKTIEAAQRSLDDLQGKCAGTDYKEGVEALKVALRIAKAWKL